MTPDPSKDQRAAGFIPAVFVNALGNSTMPRIVTMIASATEIVCALGFEEHLVARSHECDYPPTVKRLPVCTAPRFDVHGTSLDIDRRVKSLLEEATSIYRVDADLLRNLRPDLIVTQSQCEVCAVSTKDVEQALGLPSPSHVSGGGAPKIVSLSPNNLLEVWQSIRNVADALGVSSHGEALVHQLKSRVDALARRAASIGTHPTVACLEWLDPLMAAGNWVPELVSLAGGRNLFGEAGKHSPWMSWDQLIQYDPNIIVALPCGFDLAKTRAELAPLLNRSEWQKLRAVRDGQVFATDGNQFFNRPGPRLVESLEILAEIFHPHEFQYGHVGSGWECFAACGVAATK
jgi:iron complex transport system substrate-binding protein